jgi:hypothetical protein
MHANGVVLSSSDVEAQDQPESRMASVKKFYSYAEAKAAIDRSNGQRLSTGPGEPDQRQPYNATGKQLGHEYMHRGHVERYNTAGDHPSGTRTLSQRQANMLAKSRTENRDMSYRLAEYLLNTPQVQQELGDLDNNVGNPQKWLKHVPVTDNTLYGFAAGSDAPRQITAAAINVRKIGGELFVASVYPVAFMGERPYDLGYLF